MEDLEARIVRLKLLAKAIEGIEVVSKAIGELIQIEAKAAGVMKVTVTSDDSLDDIWDRLH